ncbi:hypothetical protein PCANB_001762 [Pneumocystis canis]|nr:hypothetical protein PCK1_002058 [Pneumocystis canis]KAG5440193.1 hypothetical protein PCANB_001762 [Pneumocystis canis]
MILNKNQKEQLIEERVRCICGFKDIQKEEMESDNLYIQCDHCLILQHGTCMGFSDEKGIPNIYYCEICRPDLHSVTDDSKIPPLSKYQPLNEDFHSSVNWRSFPSKKYWIINSKNTYDTQFINVSGKVVEKASSEPITSIEKEKVSLGKRKRRRNSDLPKLSIDHETKRIQTLSVFPQISLNAQCNDLEEEQLASVIKKRKKGTNTGVDIRNILVKGRQSENKNKGKANEKKTKNISDNNLDATTNSSKSKQISLKTNTQNNTNQSTDLNQKIYFKTKSKKNQSTVRHQHDTRQAQIQKDSKEQIPPNVLNTINKPSRPRIPQPKITMTEMKKRVAAILEYIGRTQLEIASDEEHKKKLFHPLLEKIDKEIIHKKDDFTEKLNKEKLMNLSDNKDNIIETSLDTKIMNNDVLQYNFDSFEMMDNLTKQLLEWKEKYGSYKENL